jgi:hypothetical protein
MGKVKSTNINSNEVEDSLKNEESSEISELTTKIVNSKTGLALEKLEQEIRLGYRVFNYDNKVYHICLPSVKDDSMITNFKARRTSELLKDKNTILKDEIIKNLKERGVWDESKDKKEKELRDRISLVYRDLMIENSKVESIDNNRIEELMQERVAIELDLLLLAGSKNDLLQSSLESQLEVDVTKFKLTLCIKDENGNRIWNSFDELENYSDKGLINSIHNEAIYFWAGLDQSMFDVSPN